MKKIVLALSLLLAFNSAARAATCNATPEQEARWWQETANYFYNKVSPQLSNAGIALAADPSLAFLKRRLINDPFTIQFKVASGTVMQFTLSVDADFLHGKYEPIKIQRLADKEGNIVKCVAKLGLSGDPYDAGRAWNDPNPSGGVSTYLVENARTKITVLRLDPIPTALDYLLEEYLPN